MTNVIDLDLQALLNTVEDGLEDELNTTEIQSGIVDGIMKQVDLMEQTLKNTLYEAALNKQELLNHIGLLEDSSMQDREDLLALEELVMVAGF